MANTPYMNLVLPTVSQTLGPEWATQLVAALSLIDSHTHAAGQGVQVPSAGINVNTDLSFGGFNAYQLRTARFADQGGTLSSAGDVGCVYLVSGNLWFNSGAGTPVQITNGGSIAGTPGSITGLVAPAAVTYSPASTKFTFTSNTNVNAQIDAAQLTIRQPIASANGVTIQSPASLAANYSITLPGSLPAGARLLTLDNNGQLAAAWSVDSATVQVASNLVSAIGVTAAGANASATIRGNRSAADAGADVVLTGQTTRTAGLIVDVQNPPGTSKFNIDFDGRVNGGALPAIVSMASDFGTASTTAVDVTGLSFSCVSGKTYVVHAKLYVLPTSGGTAVVNVALKSSGAPTVSASFSTTAVFLWDTWDTALGGGFGATLASTGNAAQVKLIEIDCAFTTTSTGTVQIQIWRGSGGGTINIQQGSYIRHQST